MGDLDVLEADWAEIMGLLNRIESSVASNDLEPLDKWSSTLEVAGELDEKIRLFFTGHNPLPDIFLPIVQRDGDRLMVTLKQVYADAGAQKQQILNSASLFVKGKKGIAAYKKV